MNLDNQASAHDQAQLLRTSNKKRHTSQIFYSLGCGRFRRTTETSLNLVYKARS